jgi:polysaccharide export outer membrane protein
MSKQSCHYGPLLLAGFLLLAPSAFARNRDQAQKEKPKSSESSVGKGTNGDTSGTQSSPDMTKQEVKNDAVPNGYEIGADDELYISVWKEPDFSTIVAVRPDGIITLPLLNYLKVIGLRPTELQTLLTEKLKPYVNDPHVTVIVRSIRSRKVFVYGSVMKAGAYPIGGSLTVLELLADAGGLSPFAKKGSIYVVRRMNNKQIKIHFNYKNALKGINPAENFELFPGDVLVVP